MFSLAVMPHSLGGLIMPRIVALFELRWRVRESCHDFETLRRYTVQNATGTVCLEHESHPKTLTVLRREHVLRGCERVKVLWDFPKIRVPEFWGPYNKDPII